VLGIDPAEASFMEKRILSVAESVGLRGGRASCLTTIAIVVKQLARPPRNPTDSAMETIRFSMNEASAGSIPSTTGQMTFFQRAI
ncbi:MAG TPA: hypothetical protein VE221_04380, partial [Sphingomicrobium sp.]|nr:hypothetical protein [Sphingomicrobium sp.]